MLLSARYLGLRGQSAHWVAERPTLRNGYHRNDAARNRARSMYSASALCGVGGSIRSKCRCHALDSRIIHYGIPAVAGMSYEEHVMSMNKDQVKGRVNETEGKVREVAGKVVGDEKLEAKGKVQRVIGTAQAKFGDVKQDVKDSLKKDA